MGKKLILVGAVVVVLLVGAGAVWYFVLDDDEPEKLTSGCDPAPCEAATGETIEGTWQVVGDESSAGLAITETIGGVADHTAAAEIGGVAGTVEITGSQVTAADITVDMTTVEFTDSPPAGSAGSRSNAMRDRGLETATFPEATFTLTSPIDLPDDVGSGETVQAEATGELTLHGVTDEITFGVDVTADGDRFQISPTEFIPVVLADHDIEVQAPGFVADISDEGTFDFLLVLQQA